jgi:shikimate dehydrogenase
MPTPDALQIGGSTPVYAVWGHPVSHSASPAMHNAALAAMDLPGVYVAFDVAPERVAEAVAGVRALGVRGVNVTVPLKERVGAHLDGLTPQAARLGAVNTLFWEEGKLLGDSTDGPGYLEALNFAGVAVGEGTQAVVLGAGGSARSVVDALAQAGATVVVLNRTRERAAEVAGRFGARHAPWGEATLRLLLPDADLLINTTSVGRSGTDGDVLPIPREALHERLFVSDLNYGPTESDLLARARERGCRVQDGIELLVRQGALSLARWTGADPPVAVMRRAVEEKLGHRGA